MAEESKCRKCGEIVTGLGGLPTICTKCIAKNRAKTTFARKYDTWKTRRR